jgi:2'-5' RNA ligase
MHQRYFIGITLPDNLTDVLAKIQGELRDVPGLMEPLVPHITLLHPNILMTLSPLYFVPKVKIIASKTLPIKIDLTKTALFDKRVLHIVVKSPELIRLQSELVELLPDDIRARYQVGREFTPHVTIAQAKPLQELPETLIDNLRMKVDPLLPEKFEAVSLSQFTWLKPRTYKVATLV